MTPNIHDSFLRTVFSAPEHAASLLAIFLGKDFSRDYDLSSLTLLSGTHVDPAFVRHETDFLFRVKSANKSVYIYVLMEHQSTPFAMMPVRLFRYVAKIFHTLEAENRSLREVPEIIPVVLYNGTRKWTAPTKLSDFYQQPDSNQEPRDAAVELEYKLVDLSTIPDQQIRQENRATTHVSILALLFLKHIHDAYFGVLLQQWAFYFRRAYRETNGEGFLESTICYILETTDVARDELIDCIVPYTEPEVETMIKTTGQKLREEGRIQGRQEGRQEGQEEGWQKGCAAGRQEGRAEGCQAAAKALKIVLISRFRALTDDENFKIDGAELAQLNIYLDRALNAKTVDEVLQ